MKVYNVNMYIVSDIVMPYHAIYIDIFFFFLFFMSHQQSFSYKGTGPPGMNQY